MKRNFDEPIFDLDGQPIRVGATLETLTAAVNRVFPKLSAELQGELAAAIEKEAGAPLTLGGACVGALMSVYRGEEEMDDRTRMGRMELARKIFRGGVVDVTLDELALVKPLLRKKWAGSIVIPVVAGELLEVEPVALVKA